MLLAWFTKVLHGFFNSHSSRSLWIPSIHNVTSSLFPLKGGVHFLSFGPEVAFVPVVGAAACWLIIKASAGPLLFGCLYNETFLPLCPELNLDLDSEA